MDISECWAGDVKANLFFPVPGSRKANKPSGEVYEDGKKNHNDLKRDEISIKVPY